MLRSNRSRRDGILRARRAGLRGPARATALLEFALILPAILFLVIFSIDLGHLLLIKGAFQDATYAAARAGAQTGAPGDTTGGRSARTFADAAKVIPTVDARQATLVLVEPNICTQDTQDVVVRSTYPAHLITPGLRGLLGIISGQHQGPDGTYALTQTAISKCEIVRDGQ